MELGKRIRSLRRERSFSLEQLSSRSGVALATLSRIENGKGTGTFRTHQRIAKALELSLLELYRDFDSPQEEAVLVEPASQEAETFTYDEKASAILLTAQISGKQMLPQLIVLQTGGKTTIEQYRKGTERWLYCLEGIVEVSVGSGNYRMNQGETLYLKAALPHQFTNKEKATARLISVTTPAAL